MLQVINTKGASIIDKTWRDTHQVSEYKSDNKYAC